MLLQTMKAANVRAAPPAGNGAPDPHLPPSIQLSTGPAPRAPLALTDLDIDGPLLLDLALKVAFTTAQVATSEAARRMHLPQALVSDLLEHLRTEHLLDILGEAGPFGYRYTITQRGRERAQRLMEISGYIGPAPVSLAAYNRMLEWQLAQQPRIAPEQVTHALRDLVLPQDAGDVAGFALSAGRSLFLHGPPGNGKTSLGRSLHQALPGELWIPHCLSVGSDIIGVFDPQVHEPLPLPEAEAWKADGRWVRIRRPLIVAGGEMTLEACDLRYSRALRSYQAPLHFKANGGTFLIDDFGRQHVDPAELLNRWIIPLEHQIDYLTLETGQKIQVPFRLFLIFATNLDLESVTDAAFRRRMGYQLCLEAPSAENYERIFEQYVRRKGLAVPSDVLSGLLARYREEGRVLKSCEPRDLIERALEIAAFRGEHQGLTAANLDRAWKGYFGPPL